MPDKDIPTPTFDLEQELAHLTTRAIELNEEYLSVNKRIRELNEELARRLRDPATHEDAAKPDPAPGSYELA